ncbi:hypothetical protein M3Y94_00291200 [Aphelenchoides besseyi]|nr:hypothetical protein M3Y94_00291200 [Aphelenchoides besseyi]KAI6235901.1 Zinc-ribbon-16 domain-containing protein [Aphelenchoides besseyi]
MPSKSKKAKSRKPMESIEEEALPPSISFSHEYPNSLSRRQLNISELQATLIASGVEATNEEETINPGKNSHSAPPSVHYYIERPKRMESTQLQLSEENLTALSEHDSPLETPHQMAVEEELQDRTVVIKTDPTASISRLSIDHNRIDSNTSISDMFHPYINSVEGIVQTEIKERRTNNGFNSEVHLLSSDSENVEFITVTKNELSLYDLCYSNGSEPVVCLQERRTFTDSTDNTDYTCKYVAVDQSKNSRVAFGFNSGDIFLTTFKSTGDFDWCNSHHIRMGERTDSIVSLAWDKTIYGKSYLCCAYERGRESEHYISLYDVNQGKDLLTDRDVSEKVFDMQFLSADLSVLMLNCMKSIRFVDLRERSGFAAIMNLNVPLFKLAMEPYNNVQFAGSITNDVTVFDRRYLARAIFEYRVGPETFDISHLEYNPNRYGNITCCSSTAGMMYELEVSPTPTYAHHLLYKQSLDPQETIVSEYANRFSYGIEDLNTSLQHVQHFRWCHQTPGLLIAASPCYPYEENGVEYDDDWLQIRAMFIERERYAANVLPDGSIVCCNEDGFSQLHAKTTIAVKEAPKTTNYFLDHENNDEKLVGQLVRAGEVSKEKMEELTRRLKIARSKPTFELEPEEIDLIFEMEQREREMLNEKIDRNHFEAPPEEAQRRIPFLKYNNQAPKVNKELQLWFTRSDINKLSLLRAKRGYGFATACGSASAITKNCYYAIRDRPEETECLKECWKMLTRIYSSNISMTRYGTVFPGVRRIARGLKSTAGARNDSIIYRNKYYSSHSRDDILRLVGWVPLEERDTWGSKFERMMNTEGLEEKLRAAAMAMFYMQGYACKLYLNKTIDYMKTRECTERYSQSTLQSYRCMITQMINTIDSYNGIQIANFDELLEIMEDPYLMIMLRFLARRQFVHNYMQRHIMAMHTIRLDDRIAIAAIHMDDEGFRQSLRLLTKSVRKSHDPLSVLLISGLDDHKYAHLAIHSYLAQTNDIQTAALILCAGNCFRKSKIWETYDMRKSVMERITIAIANNALKNTRKYSLQIVLSYMEWLQSNNLTLQKSYIMTFLRKKLEFPKNDPKIQAGRTQGLVACNFCGKPILPFIGDSNETSAIQQPSKVQPNGPNNRRMMSVAHSLQIAEMERRKLLPKSRGCPHCGRPLPCCLICKRVCIQQKDGPVKMMDDWFIWCTQCAHGGHLNHLRDWFSLNQLCPAGDCQCACPQIDNLFNANFKPQNIREEEFDDPILLNGFAIDTLTATMNGLGRESDEHEKERLIQTLKFQSQTLKLPSVSLNSLRNAENRALKHRKSKPFRDGNTHWSTENYKRNNDDANLSELPEQPISMSEMYNNAPSDRHSDYDQMIVDGSPPMDFGFEHEHHEMTDTVNDTNSFPRLDSSNDADNSLFGASPTWDMTPEIIKQSSTIKKILKARRLKQSLKELQINAEPDIPEDEENDERSRRSTGELSIEEERQLALKTEQRQKLNFTLRQQTKMQRLQNRPHIVEKPIADTVPSPEKVVAQPKPTSNRWIVNDKDNIGRPVATQVTVNLDKNKTTTKRDLGTNNTNIQFNEHTHLLPSKVHPIIAAGLRSPQILQQMAAVEVFKVDVMKEKQIIDTTEKLSEELLNEQEANDELIRSNRERHRSAKEERLAKRKSHRESKAGSSYFSYDYNAIDVQMISSGSDEDESEDAKEIAELCRKVHENIRIEREELQRLKAQGFDDLNSLANALKEAEEKKKRHARKASKRVRIRNTPDVKQRTPESKKGRETRKDKGSRTPSARSYDPESDTGTTDARKVESRSTPTTFNSQRPSRS